MCYSTLPPPRYNRLLYNVAICPWSFDSKTKHGCTVPGTDNGEGDTSLNQAGFYATTITNHLVGNRASNHFNGEFMDSGRQGRPNRFGISNVCLNRNLLGRHEGNTFHGSGRFGTYAQSIYCETEREGRERGRGRERTCELCNELLCICV